MFSLSILIPVYNVEQYLPECLDSILARNGFDGEVICVDDGSTDRSPEILAIYARRYPNVKIVRQKNTGLSAARNAALRIAVGDYVMFVDSDDYLTDNAIKTLLTKLSGEDVLYYNAQRFYDKTNDKFPTVPLPDINGMNGRTYYEQFFSRKNFMPCVCVWAAAYRREFLQKNNLCNKVGVTHQDEDFYPRVLYYAKNISTINDVLYCYRLREGATMQSVSQKQCTDFIEVASSLVDFFRENHWINPTTLNAAFYIYISMLNYTVEHSLKRPKEYNLSQVKKMLFCSTSIQARRATLLSMISFPLALKYYNYSIPKYQRKLINLILH